MFLSKLIKKQSFLHIFFFLNVLSSIFSTSTAAQNIQLIDPKAESRKLPKSWDSILNDWERHPSTNWWHVIVTFVFPAIGMGLFGLLIVSFFLSKWKKIHLKYSCVRLCKWFHARREALLLAMETRRIKRSRSRSISRKSTAEKPKKEEKKEEANDIPLEKTKSRPELSIDIESKTVGGPPQIISGVHINESKSENSLSLDLEFRPTKTSEKSIGGGNIQMLGSMRDGGGGGGGTFSGSGSLGSPSIVGDGAPAVGSLRINMPVSSSLRKNGGSLKKKKEEISGSKKEGSK